MIEYKNASTRDGQLQADFATHCSYCWSRVKMKSWGKTVVNPWREVPSEDYKSWNILISNICLTHACRTNDQPGNILITQKTLTVTYPQFATQPQKQQNYNILVQNERPTNKLNPPLQEHASTPGDSSYFKKKVSGLIKIWLGSLTEAEGSSSSRRRRRRRRLKFPT